ncbi:hypothetical protein AHF37_06392 [Paragonimus kellicotti]|nr:hypothetical protein AHF37_06392 [Paragonimus kellicotti]
MPYGGVLAEVDTVLSAHIEDDPTSVNGEAQFFERRPGIIDRYEYTQVPLVESDCGVRQRRRRWSGKGRYRTNSR